MYIQLEHANITTLDVASSNDPEAVMIQLRGEDVLSMQEALDDPRRWEPVVVGKLTEIRGDLWFALDSQYIRDHPEVVMRAARASNSAFRAAGWDI